MSQRTKVVGTHAVIVWLLIIMAVITVGALAVGGLVVYPQLQEQRAEQTRLAEVERHYRAGIAFQDVGDWVAADAEYKQVITLDADYKDAKTRLAEVKARLAESKATAIAVAKAQAEQARADAQATAAAAPTATAEALEAHYQKGLGYMNMGRWEEAKAELEQVFAVDPNYKEVQARLAEVEAKLEELSIPTATLTPEPTDTPEPGITSTQAPVESVRTPQAEGVQVIVIDSKTHHLGDGKLSEWDVANHEGTSYTNRFWLDTSWSGGALLRLDTFHVDLANPVWVNNHLVGAVPRSGDDAWSSERWSLQVEIFVPGSILKAGENSIQIQSLDRDGYDDFMFRALQIVGGATISPEPSQQTQVVIDDAIHHIGDGKRADWAIPAPEGTFYTKYFSLDSAPQSDAILLLASFEAEYANGVWANDCYVGVLPGLGTKDWTPEVSMRIPMFCLTTGPNMIRIEALKDDKANYDDFMVKDIKILVSLK